MSFPNPHIPCLPRSRPEPAHRTHDWLADLCCRLLVTHDLAPELAARAVGLPVGVIHRMIAGAHVALDEEAAERMMLFVNIIIRLEIRTRHDSKLIRSLLAGRTALLGGSSPAETMAQGIDDLRLLRSIIADMPLPKIRMWRVADTYS